MERPQKLRETLGNGLSTILFLIGRFIGRQNWQLLSARNLTFFHRKKWVLVALLLLFQVLTFSLQIWNYSLNFLYFFFRSYSFKFYISTKVIFVFNVIPWTIGKILLMAKGTKKVIFSFYIIWFSFLTFLSLSWMNYF